MRIMKIHFGHRVGKYNPSTELPGDFCDGIGPLQLGVVLVIFLVSTLFSVPEKTNFFPKLCRDQNI